ncbi:MAG: tetratricopeptide repeat protein [Planctomycetes bacterium]|nr:tetratricopeptide repeat protein [Planctomycetota bacterium]
MSQDKDNIQGDRVIEYLERIQHWVESNYKMLIFFVVVAFASAWGWQYKVDAEVSQQMDYWTEVSKLKTIEEKSSFVQSHPDADSASILCLTLAREELDEGKYKEALGHLNIFLNSNPKHPLEATAYVLRAYANEELGDKDAALLDYQKASGEDRAVAMVADQALERLKQ